ncbi:MAG: hypothetical protein IJM80_01810 [Firmicutes bacterium]|nr:hypothetical protein [Bacillota bacterium]
MEAVNGTIVILCLVGVALAIFLSYKFNLQMGISAMVFAFIIGVLFMKLRVKEVIAMFPTSVFFQVLSLSLFFGVGVVNGTMEAIAKKMLYATRKRPYMLVFMLMVIGFALGILGCVPPAAGAILAVMGFTIAVPSGVDPLICASLGYSCNAGSFIRWGASGAIIESTIASNGYEADAMGYTWSIFGLSVVISILVMVLCFFIWKGYRVKEIVGMEQPAPFTREQKGTLTLILVVVFFAVVPGMLVTWKIGGAFMKSLSGFCDIQVLCLIGFIIAHFLKLANPREVINKCPWNTLLLLAGISMLMSVGVKAGAIKIISDWLTATIPNWLLPFFMCLLGAFLSSFSGGITVVFPMVAPIVPQLVQSSGGALNAMVLFLAAVLGAHFTGMSPFSTGGAVFMGMNRDESQAKRLVTGQLVVCLIGVVVGGIILTILGVTM